MERNEEKGMREIWRNEISLNNKMREKLFDGEKSKG